MTLARQVERCFKTLLSSRCVTLCGIFILCCSTARSVVLHAVTDTQPGCKSSKLSRFYRFSHFHTHTCSVIRQPQKHCPPPSRIKRAFTFWEVNCQSRSERDPEAHLWLSDVLWENHLISDFRPVDCILSPFGNALDEFWRKNSITLIKTPNVSPNALKAHRAQQREFWWVRLNLMRNVWLIVYLIFERNKGNRKLCCVGKEARFKDN